MATTGVHPTLAARRTPQRLTLDSAACLLAAAVTAGCFFALGIGVAGDTGAEVTAGLVDDVARYQLASVLAIFAAVGLGLAAVRLGRRIGGQAGTVATAAGAAVAFLCAAYYSAYAAGASVASFVIDDPGPGVGEATLVLLNGIEFARYAPGLLLVAAVLAARRRLPRSVTVPAWVLLVVMLVPMTTWVAALLVPVWLGVAAAVTPAGSSVVGPVRTTRSEQ
jgi:hypothetical protein